MANRLLEKDYHKIAFEAFKLSDNDQFKYYLNELEKNYKDNNDFIIELEKSINKFKNDFFSYVVENNLFVNEQGYKKVSNTNNVYVKWQGINRRVNRLFFDEQLELIKKVNVEFNIINGSQINNNKSVTFESTLTSAQIKGLAQGLNTTELFTNQLTDNTLTEVFNCTLKEPLKITNNRLLVYLFGELLGEKYICKNWQSVIEKNKLFKSNDNKSLKAGDLATAKNHIKELGLPKGFELIKEAIKTIKNIKS